MNGRRMERRRRRLLPLLLAVPALALGAAACGDDEDTAATDATTVETTPTVTAPTDTTTAPTDTTAAEGELRETVQDVLDDVQADVETLLASRSADEFTRRADALVDTLREGGERIRQAEAPEDLQDEQERLSTLVDDLANEVEDARRQAEQGDLVGAIASLGSSSFNVLTDAARDLATASGG